MVLRTNLKSCSEDVYRRTAETVVAHKNVQRLHNIVEGDVANRAKSKHPGYAHGPDLVATVDPIVPLEDVITNVGCVDLGLRFQ